jgi:hypothetical protein
MSYLRKILDEEVELEGLTQEVLHYQVSIALIIIISISAVIQQLKPVSLINRYSQKRNLRGKLLLKMNNKSNDF